MTEGFVEPTKESLLAFTNRNISDELVMLNMLRFREVADYSASPELAPSMPISGWEAYQRYIGLAAPFLQESGGSLMFSGESGKHLIGPQQEQWDLVLLIRQKSPADFMSFVSSKGYLAIVGHRTTALSDSRLLPMMET